MIPGYFEVGESVIIQRLRDEAILLDMDRQQYFGLNDTGTFIWELLAELGDPNEVVRRMAQTFSAPIAEIESDVDRLVRELLDAGLLKTRAVSVSE